MMGVVMGRSGSAKRWFRHSNSTACLCLRLVGCVLPVLLGQEQQSVDASCRVAGALWLPDQASLPAQV